MKKITVFVLALLVIAAVVVATRTDLFQGKLVFFEGAPSSQKVVSATYMKTHEAANLLINAALQAGRIDQKKAADLRKTYATYADVELSRGQFAKLAVEIFGMNVSGYGSTLTDVSSNHPYVNDIYLFSSNGGFALEYKPDNPVAKSFAEQAASNLAQRFGK